MVWVQVDNCHWVTNCNIYTFLYFLKNPFCFVGRQVNHYLASSRRSVSHGAAQKTAREKIKKARLEEARECLWENLTKGRSGIPGSGIPSDWSILTDFVNTRALLTQMGYTIWRRSETYQRVTRCSNLL